MKKFLGVFLVLTLVVTCSFAAVNAQMTSVYAKFYCTDGNFNPLAYDSATTKMEITGDYISRTIQCGVRSYTQNSSGTKTYGTASGLGGSGSSASNSKDTYSRSFSYNSRTGQNDNLTARGFHYYIITDVTQQAALTWNTSESDSLTNNYILP